MDEKELRKSYQIGQLVVVSGRVDSFIDYDLKPAPENWLVPSNWRHDDPNPEEPEWKQRGWPYRVLMKVAFNERTLNKGAHKHPILCMILGWTTRYVGSVNFTSTSYGEYGRDVEPGFIEIDARYTVFQVQPYSEDGRYRKSFAVLPEQILSGMELEEWMKKNVKQSSGDSPESLSPMQSSMGFLNSLPISITNMPLTMTLPNLVQSSSAMRMA